MSGTKRKTKTEEIKQAEENEGLFDDPGTAASEPEEAREHFEDTEQGLEQQVKKAEEVLGEDLPEKKPRRSSKRAEQAKAEAEAVIGEEMEAALDQALADELKQLLDAVELLAVKHADLACRAHRRTIHSAFLTLIERGRNLQKLTAGQKYWKAANV